MHGQKATPHRGNDNGVKGVQETRDTMILSDYERGALVAGLLTAASFGACLFHWLVIA